MIVIDICCSQHSPNPLVMSTAHPPDYEQMMTTSNMLDHQRAFEDCRSKWHSTGHVPTLSSTGNKSYQTHFYVPLWIKHFQFFSLSDFTASCRIGKYHSKSHLFRIRIRRHSKHQPLSQPSTPQCRTCSRQRTFYFQCLSRTCVIQFGALFPTSQFWASHAKKLSDYR